MMDDILFPIEDPPVAIKLRSNRVTIEKAESTDDPTVSFSQQKVFVNAQGERTSAPEEVAPIVIPFSQIANIDVTLSSGLVISGMDIAEGISLMYHHLAVPKEEEPISE
jgi:hypothetical protein